MPFQNRPKAKQASDNASAHRAPLCSGDACWSSPSQVCRRGRWRHCWSAQPALRPRQSKCQALCRRLSVAVAHRGWGTGAHTWGFHRRSAPQPSTTLHSTAPCPAAAAWHMQGVAGQRVANHDRSPRWQPWQILAGPTTTAHAMQGEHPTSPCIPADCDLRQRQGPSAQGHKRERRSWAHCRQRHSGCMGRAGCMTLWLLHARLTFWGGPLIMQPRHCSSAARPTLLTYQ